MCSVWAEYNLLVGCVRRAGEIAFHSQSTANDQKIVKGGEIGDCANKNTDGPCFFIRLACYAEVLAVWMFLDKYDVFKTQIH